LRTIGLDPQGFRLFTDFRLEGARADTGTYGRAALDLTASHGIGDAGAAALTVAAGTSAGILPTQRFWYLGGSQTVRGQRPGREAGDAFWLARAEVARGIGAIRPVVFTDFGWAGDRRNWSNIGLPMSGVGAGTSIMDGLIRFDVARGINPERQWRVDTYIEARF
jgi:hemolysin activation/secretion protein